MWPKLKCHLNQNVTQTEMSPKLKCHPNWKVIFFFGGGGVIMFFLVLFFGILVLSWFFLVYCKRWLDMEGKLTTIINHDNPRSIQTKQDQPRSNQGQLNKKTEFGTDRLGLVSCCNQPRLFTYWADKVFTKLIPVMAPLEGKQ